MKKIYKIITYIILSLLILAGTGSNLSVNAEEIRTKTDVYSYLNPNLKSNVAVIEISGLTSTQRIAKESLQSSDINVGRIRSFTRRAYSSNTSKVDKKASNSSRKSYTYQIKVNLYAVGTTVISYAIDGVVYSTTLHVNEYVNPIGSLTVTGVNSSADLAPNLDYSKGYGTGSFANVNQKKAKLNVTPAAGWRVTSVTCDNETTGYEYKKYNRSATKSLNSVTLGNLRQGDDCKVQITLADSYGNYMSVTLKLCNPATIK